MEAVECGAASLGMILGHHGRHVPLEELRLACGVTRDGSNANNILLAARSFGLKAKGFKKKVDSLGDLPLPLVVFWDFCHFLVVEGTDGDRFHLNDPGPGPRTVDRETFRKSFTGIVLAFEPGPDFEPGGQRPSFLDALRRRLAPVGVPVAFLSTVAACLLVLGLAIPAVVRVVVDRYLIEGVVDWYLPLLGALAAIWAGRLAVDDLLRSRLDSIEEDIARRESTAFVWHLLRLPVAFFQQRFGGEIASRVRLNETVAAVIAGPLLAVGIDAFLLLGFLALMLAYDVLLTTLVVGGLAACVAAAQRVHRRQRSLNERLGQIQGQLAGRTAYGLQIIETLQSTRQEDAFAEIWLAEQAELDHISTRVETHDHLMSAVPTALLAGLSLSVLLVGSWRVLDGQMTLGVLLAFAVLLLAVSGRARDLVRAAPRILEAEAELRRLDDVLAYPVDHDPAGRTVSTEAEEDRPGRLEVENLVYGYGRFSKPILSGVSFEVEAGSRIALVGQTGCGKSTLLRLLSGLIDPWQGSIRFDGRTRQIGTVDQEVRLIEGTIRENLTLWDDSIAEETIVRAMRDARLHDLVLGRPDGYETFVGEGGGALSGGERQRLEIARALCQEPGLLLLDEATTSLDPAMEREILDAIAGRNISCLIITHRLETIRDFDRILVLGDGRILEAGTHDELLAAGGAYAALLGAAESRS